MSWGWVLCLFGRHDWQARQIRTNDGWQDFGDRQCMRCRVWHYGSTRAR